MPESIYGVWDHTGHCHGDKLTKDQAHILVGRCVRLLPSNYAPFFIGTERGARLQGFKNVRGEKL